WENDELAPDFARTIDIHRKLGYDPVELFIDPGLRWPKLSIASFLLRRKIGLRALLNIIPLDATLVRGSHGRRVKEREQWPILLLEKRSRAEQTAETLTDTEVHEQILRFCTG